MEEMLVSMAFFVGKGQNVLNSYGKFHYRRHI